MNFLVGSVFRQAWSPQTPVGLQWTGNCVKIQISQDICVCVCVCVCLHALHLKLHWCDL